MPAAGQRIKALDYTASAQSSDNNDQKPMGTTYSPGSPEVAVTVTAPTSGKVQVAWGGLSIDSTGIYWCVIAWECRKTNSSGQVVHAVGSSQATECEIPTTGTIAGQGSGRTWTLSGLTPGQPYYFRLHHKAASSTVSLVARSLTVTPLVA